jgi:hypothetical protein
MAMHGPSRHLKFDECLCLVRALLADRPTIKPFSIGITTTTGRVMTIDSSQNPVVSEEPRYDVALSLVTNEDTLSGVLCGTLEPANPGPTDLLVVAGDLTQWTNLIDTVAAVNSIGVRLLGRGDT